MIKTSILSMLLVFTCSLVSAQNAEGLKHIEALKKELPHTKIDTNRVLLFAELCNAYQWTNEDSLDFYSQAGLALAKQLQFKRGEIRILNSQATTLYFKGNAPKALEILFRILRLAERNKYPLETAICLNSIGSTYWFLNDYSKGLDFINRARTIDETIHHTMADIYWKIYIEVWAGIAYSGLNKLDSANIILQRAYKEAFEPGFNDYYSIRPTVLMFLGEVQFKLGNHEAGLMYLHESMAKFNTYNDQIGISDVCFIIAGFFKEINQPDSVIHYAKIGLNAAIKFNYVPAILNNSRVLAEQYESTDIKQSHYYLKMELAANDSLYGAQNIQQLQKTLSEEQQRQQQIEEEQIVMKNRLKQYVFLAGLGVLLIIAFILFRNNKQKQKANILLQRQKDEINIQKEKVETTLSDLRSTQSQLIQSEKMASLGELTAGIAHEIQNPLNFVNNFSEVNSELIKELEDAASSEPRDAGNEAYILTSIKENSEKINHHGKRADAIVKGMLQHSQKSVGVKELTDINALADEYFRLTYHSYQSKNDGFYCELNTELDSTLPLVNVIPQDIGRVLLNLFNNAFWAVNERLKTEGVFETPSVLAPPFSPSVTLTTKKLSDNIEIRIHDNGPGIPHNIIDKIFQPFFTTKPTGQGTGLGLSLAYDIVKAHGSEIKVKTEFGTTFMISLPVNR